MVVVARMESVEPRTSIDAQDEAAAQELSRVLSEAINEKLDGVHELQVRAGRVGFGLAQYWVLCLLACLLAGGFWV